MIVNRERPLRSSSAGCMSCARRFDGSVGPREPVGSPPPRERSGLRVALVVPFVARQLDKIDRALEHWASYVPCELAPTDVGSVSVVFVYDGDLERPENVLVKRTLRRLWRKNVEEPYFASCFGGGASRFGAPAVEFLSSRLDPSYGHVEGAAAMFYALFPMLEQKYHAFFLAESDCLPVQPNWVSSLLEEASRLGCESYGHWQRGSAPQHHPSFGQLTYRGDLHMNGNSLYLLGCRAFEEYMCRAQNYYPPFEPDCPRVAGCATGRGNEEGYDHVLFRYRQQPENLLYTRNVLERFSYTKFVMNLGEEPYTPSEVVERSANRTFFVHSKAAHFSQTQIELTQAYLVARERYPTPSEVARQYITLRSRETSKAQIVSKLCQKLVRESRRMPRLQSDVKHGATSARDVRKAIPSDFDLAKLGPKAVDFLRSPERFRNALLTFHNASSQQQKQMLPAACRNEQPRVTRAKEPWTELVPPRLAYLWTVDFSAGPVSCILPLLVEAGAAVHAEVDGPDCARYGLCKRRLEVLSYEASRGISLDLPDPASLRERFLAHYTRDDEFRRVDAFLCSYPAANCELFVPFNKSLIVYVTSRLEFGRFDSFLKSRKPYVDDAKSLERWRSWVQTLIDLSRDPKHVIVANSRYDVEYIRFYTGIDAEYVPSWCGDDDGSYGDPFIRGEAWFGSCIHPKWTPTRSEFIVLQQGLEGAITQRELQDASIRTGLRFVSIDRERSLASQLENRSLLNYRALIVVPHDVSELSLTALYRMNIPMFVPSAELLTTWCEQGYALTARRIGQPPHEKGLIGAPLGAAPDPNLQTRETLTYWLPLVDANVLPHLIRFDSVPDLVSQLSREDIDETLERATASMAAHNAELRRTLAQKWASVLGRVREHQRRDSPDPPS